MGRNHNGLNYKLHCVFFCKVEDVGRGRRRGRLDEQRTSSTLQSSRPMTGQKDQKEMAQKIKYPIKRIQDNRGVEVALASYGIVPHGASLDIGRTLSV